MLLIGKFSGCTFHAVRGAGCAFVFSHGVWWARFACNRRRFIGIFSCVAGQTIGCPFRVLAVTLRAITTFSAVRVNGRKFSSRTDQTLYGFFLIVCFSSLAGNASRGSRISLMLANTAPSTSFVCCERKFSRCACGVVKRLKSVNGNR